MFPKTFFCSLVPLYILSLFPCSLVEIGHVPFFPNTPGRPSVRYHFGRECLARCYRIVFKILLITFKILRGLAPDYLTNLIIVYQPPRQLCFSNKTLLVIPPVSLVSYGHRAFSFAAPTLWNQLPHSVKSCQTVQSFKSALKTFLFCNRYFSR